MYFVVVARANLCPYKLYPLLANFRLKIDSLHSAVHPLPNPHPRRVISGYPPRDKYGDEFDAVRERTSAVPFQVRWVLCAIARSSPGRHMRVP